jgi:hypothetical protein
MHFTLLNETEIAALQLDKRNSYFRMMQLMNTTTVPLHVIIKELANTSWSLLPEELLRKLHEQATAVHVPGLAKLTLPNYVPTTVKGKFCDLDITYEWEDVGLLKPILVVDEIFLEGINLTELLSEASVEAIAQEAEALLEKEAGKDEEEDL